MGSLLMLGLLASEWVLDQWVLVGWLAVVFL